MRAFPFPKLHRAAGWLAVLVIGAAAATAAETPPSAVHIALRPEADVSRTHITLGDIATVSADSQEMRNALLALRVASAPRIGYVDRYSRAEVELVVRRGLASKKVKAEWSGARFVKVKSIGRTLEAGAVVDAARAAALKQLGEKFETVDLQLAAPLDDMALPMGELRFKPRAIDTSHVASRLPVWVDIDVDGVPYRSVVVPFNVNASQLVLVARRDLAQGGAVSADDFELRMEQVSSRTVDAVPAAELRNTGRMRRALAAHAVLTRSDLAPQGAALHGDQVKLVLVDGGLVIETLASVQQGGGVGDMVKVKAEKSSDAIVARMVSPGLVLAGGR